MHTHPLHHAHPTRDLSRPTCRPHPHMARCTSPQPLTSRSGLFFPRRCGGAFSDVILIGRKIDELAGYTHRIMVLFRALNSTNSTDKNAALGTWTDSSQSSGEFSFSEVRSPRLRRAPSSGCFRWCCCRECALRWSVGVAHANSNDPRGGIHSVAHARARRVRTHHTHFRVVQHISHAPVVIIISRRRLLGAHHIRGIIASLRRLGLSRYLAGSDPRPREPGRNTHAGQRP